MSCRGAGFCCLWTGHAKITIYFPKEIFIRTTWASWKIQKRLKEINFWIFFLVRISSLDQTDMQCMVWKARISPCSKPAELIYESCSWNLDFHREEIKQEDIRSPRTLVGPLLPRPLCRHNEDGAIKPEDPTDALRRQPQSIIQAVKNTQALD